MCGAIPVALLSSPKVILPLTVSIETPSLLTLQFVKPAESKSSLLKLPFLTSSSLAPFTNQYILSFSVSTIDPTHFDLPI